MNRNQLEQYLNELLNIESFKDYGPNGLQIEGTSTIKKMAFAVSATLDSVKQAVDNKADCLIVHHGLFWQFHGPRPLTGPFARRVYPLIKNNINLFGYHLPLDAHLEFGNAATLARELELTELSSFGDYKNSPLGVKGTFKKPVKATTLKEKLSLLLNHSVIHASPDDEASLQSIGIITGGANSYWKQASAEGLDAYITGEISEHDWHDSKEANVHMFAGGHNATEEFGIKNLMNHLQKKFQIESFFIGSDNPA